MMDSVVRYIKNGIYSTNAFTNYYQKQAKKYRSNIFLKLMGFPIRFLITFVLWSIVLSGESNGENSYYVWYYAGVFLILLMYPYARVANTVVGQDIFNGEIVKYLTKGIPYWSVRLADWLVVIRFYIPIMFGFYIVMLCIFYTPPNIVNLIGFLYLLIIGSLIQLILWTMVGIGAFWLEQTQGLSRLFGFLQEILAGALIPLHLLPETIQQIIQYLPFQYFVYIPIQVLVGKETAYEVILNCLQSTIWLIFLLICSHLLWKKGLKKYLSPL